MELKVKTPTFPEVIEFNFDELKTEIAERAANYVNLVYTDDQISDAKKDRATLNKFVKALSDERIKIKKECLKPYEDFEKKIKELDGIVGKAIQNIDSQIKGYEEQKKAEKLETIKEYWNRVTSPEHPLKFERVMDNKWLNASVSMKSIQEEINGILAKYAEDVATLQKLPEFSFEAIETYKSSLSITEALNEAHRRSEMERMKAEAERQKAEAEMAKHMNPTEDQNEGQISFTDAKTFDECIPKPVEPQRFWLGFKAHLTVADAQYLKRFFEVNEITFEQIAI